MRTKDHTVNLLDLHPKLAARLPYIDQWCKINFGYEAVITSGCDGEHSQYSAHYWGGAIDLRTWVSPHDSRQIDQDRDALAQSLRELLGWAFQVLDEGTHFHVALKPERPLTWAKMV